jgi:very-short-patch-repair endonuclease
MSDYSDIPMFYDAPPDIFSKARSLRLNMTPAEIKVWNFLKGKNILGQRFRAQHPLGFYIADFYCHSIKLIIEIDGEIHYDKIQKECDDERTRDLNNWKIDVIRFTNDQVFNEFEFVQQQIIIAVQTRLKLFPVQQNRSPFRGFRGHVIHVKIIHN